ncbi:unnamed protein product [Camellia sinensis]
MTPTKQSTPYKLNGCELDGFEVPATDWKDVIGLCLIFIHFSWCRLVRLTLCLFRRKIFSTNFCPPSNTFL